MRDLLLVAPFLFEGRAENYLFSRLRETLKPLDSVHLGVLPIKQYKYDVIMDTYYANIVKRTIEVLDQFRGIKQILFCDGWNPAIPNVFHYCEATKRPMKYHAIVHGSTWVKNDYLHGSGWARDFERYLLGLYDNIFVATTSLMLDLSHVQNPNVHVTGLPIDRALIKNYEDRDYNVVFPHTLTPARNFEGFIKLARYWKKKVGDNLSFEIFTNKPVSGVPEGIKIVYNKTKEEYYERLGRARYVWSGSSGETFGYSIIEAYLSGCYLILNNLPTYKELFDDCFYTATLGSQVDLIKNPKKPKAKFEFNAEEKIREIIENVAN